MAGCSKKNAIQALRRNHLHLGFDDMFVPSSLTTRDYSTASMSSRSSQQRVNGLLQFQLHRASVIQTSNTNRGLDFLLLPGSPSNELGSIVNYAIKFEHMREKFALEILKRKKLEKQLAENEDLLRRARQDVVDSCFIINRKEHEMAQLENKLKREKERELNRKREFQIEMGNILKSFKQVQEEYLMPEGTVRIEQGENSSNANNPTEAMQQRQNKKETTSTASTALVTQQQEPSSSTVNLERKSVRKHGLDKCKSFDDGYFCRCGSKFTAKRSLLSHVARCDPSNHFFVCSECKKRFCRTNELKTHMLSKHKITLGNMYGCRTCGEIYKTVCELLEHRREMHAIKRSGQKRKALLLRSVPLKSDVHHVRASSKAVVTKVTTHVRIPSTEPDKMACSCGKVYRFKSSFNTHVWRAAKKKNKMSMKSTLARQKKALVKKPSECQIKHACASTQSSRDIVRCTCGIRFESRRGLIKHLQRYKLPYKKKNVRMAMVKNVDK